MDNKISNILGVKIPDWLYGQLMERSKKNSLNSRSKNEDILYMGQKTAWVRLVSSVNIVGEQDKRYFREEVGAVGINKDDDLAKNYILFAGTSKFNNRTETNWLRTGVYDPNKSGQNPAYGMLGSSEIKQFGYRPMPGLTSVNIETQGRLGSVRAATINFKCWNKAQLDIIDALYFKLGYTMFLEWGQTYFVASEERTVSDKLKLIPGGVYSTETFMMNPFESDLTKEQILERIADNTRDSEGNYDAMLGMCTNFNFTYNQEGGYDCTMKLMSMGILADSTKINHTSEVPGILDEQIKLYNQLLDQKRLAEEEAARAAEQEKVKKVREYAEKVVRRNGVRYINFPGNPYDGKTWDSFLANEGLSEDYLNSQTPVIEPNGEPPKIDVSLTNEQFTAKYDTGTTKQADVYYTYPSNSNKKKNVWVTIPNTGSYVVSEGSNFRIERPIDPKYRVVLNKNLIVDKIVKNPEFVRNIWGSQDQADKQQDTYEDDVYKKEAPEQLDTAGDNDDYWKWRARVAYRSDVTSIDPNNPKKDFFLGVEILEMPKPIGLAREGDTGGETVVKDPLNPDEDLENVYKDLNHGWFVADGTLKLPLWRFKTMLENELYNATWRFQDSSFKNIPSKNEEGFRLVGNVDNFSVNSPNGTYKGFFNLEGQVTFKYAVERKQVKPGDPKDAELLFRTKVAIYSNDTALIQSVTQKEKSQDETSPVEDKDLPSPPVTGEPPQSEDPATKNSPLVYLSAVEIALRAIQIHSLIQNLSGGMTSVTPVPLWSREDVTGAGDKKMPFIDQVFSGGILTPIIRDLIDGKYASTHEEYKKANEDKKFAIRAQYGFATNLMANRAKLDNFIPVDYKKLFTSFVVPYEINQSLEEGTIANHPVYIPLGFFLSILTNNCMLYDTGKDGKTKKQTPIAYLDYNPNHNFCLSNKQHLSTDPFTALIPFEGQDADFKAIFDEDVIEVGKDEIKAPSIAPAGPDGNNSNPPTTTPIWKPRSSDDLIRDQISGVLVDTAPFKDTDGTKVIYYRGRVMNILLNIDYLMGLIKGSASKSEENRVTLKPVIEQVLSSLNKCLGNINVFRFSYVDAGNVHQITDDQIIPPKSGEAVVTSKESKQRPLPLVGEASIAKSLDIKTEVSSKLANMIAIGANSDKSKQSTLGSGGDTFGFINDNFVDRYIPNRTEPTNVSTSLDGKINSAVQFNNAIKSFYNSVNPDQSQVEAATSYYVDRMSNVKGRESATRASAMIPVSLNFKTNGISGLAMGHCFTIPDILLPYTYSPKKTEGKKTDVVGFVVTGVSNTIESNIWDTSIKTNMIFLKNPEDYLLGEGSQIERRPSSLPPRPSNPFTSFDDSNALPISPGDPKTNLSIFKKELVAAGFSKEMVIAAMANVMKECGGKLIEEYVNYANTSNERIKDIFGSRMKNKSDAEITRLKNNQEEWLEAIYGVNSGKTGKNLGNTERGDAVKFIGRPWIGFTGKGIYSKYSKLVYGDERLVENPRLLMQADIASKVSAAYIKNLIPTYERGLGVNSKSISQADANLLITSMVGGQFLNRNNLNKIFTEIVNRVDGFSKTISRDYDKY